MGIREASYLFLVNWTLNNVTSVQNESNQYEFVLTENTSVFDFGNKEYLSIYVSFTTKSEFLTDKWSKEVSGAVQNFARGYHRIHSTNPK